MDPLMSHVSMSCRSDLQWASPSCCSALISYTWTKLRQLLEEQTLSFFPFIPQWALFPYTNAGCSLLWHGGCPPSPAQVWCVGFILFLVVAFFYSYKLWESDRRFQLSSMVEYQLKSIPITGKMGMGLKFQLKSKLLLEICGGKSSPVVQNMDTNPFLMKL